MTDIGKIAFSEFFGGPGGMALGIMQACADMGVTCAHLWAVDNHKSTCETYRKNIAHAPDHVLERDVKDVDVESLPAPDLFLFGFPCNDFSLVGERRGLGGEYGGLYKYGVRVLEALRPRFFIAENVSGLGRSDHNGALGKILADMRAAGYRVWPHMYKLEEYGIPQTRHRILVVGIREDLPGEFRVPAPCALRRTVRDALENPPIPLSAPNHDFRKQAPQVVKRLEHTRPGENIWQAQMRPDFPDDCKLKPTGASISQIYKRLDPNKPSYTITGSGGGGTHGYHWSEPRALTNRERARIQTFPDDFVFCGGPCDVRRQVGMAVPPMAARMVMTALLKSVMGKIDYADVPCNIKG